MWAVDTAHYLANGVNGRTAAYVWVNDLAAAYADGSNTDECTYWLEVLLAFKYV